MATALLHVIAPCKRIDYVFRHAIARALTLTRFSSARGIVGRIPGTEHVQNVKRHKVFADMRVPAGIALRTARSSTKAIRYRGERAGCTPPRAIDIKA